MKDREKALKEVLGHHFIGHSRRIEALVKLVVGLLHLGSVSYSKLSKVTWKLLNKQGNSNTEERIAVVERLLSHLSKEQ